MELWGREISQESLTARVGRLEQVAGVRLVTLGDGSGRGVRVLEFELGGLRFEVLVDRGFDVGACSFRGVPLAWTSPVGVVGPWYREQSEFGFLRGFGGGLLVTCGLEHALGPVEDAPAQAGASPKESEVYPQHGRISASPARLLGYGESWSGEECILWAEGEVEQASVFGEHLVVRRRLEARVGSATLTVKDTVENRGHQATPHMLLYHVNVGWPIVDDGSFLLANPQSVKACDGGGVGDHHLLGGPGSEQQERVFEQRLPAAADGSASVGIANPALGLGLYQRYPVAELPYHLIWRMLGRGQYVVGIEPSTNSAAGRLAAREAGELIELSPGETRATYLELGVLDGVPAIESFASRIGASARLGGRGSPEGA